MGAVVESVKQTKTSFEKNCFSAWASTLNMGLINKVDMVCLSPVGYGVLLSVCNKYYHLLLIRIKLVI